MLFNKYIPYSNLSSSSQNDQHFSKFVKWLDNVIFIFSKTLQLFTKRVTEGLFDSIVSKEKNRGSGKHSKFEGTIFYLKYFIKRNFQRPRFF